ncbi:MAG: hypothetical protein ACK44F_13320 [Roseococcus sp.]
MTGFVLLAAAMAGLAAALAALAEALAGGWRDPRGLWRDAGHPPALRGALRRLRWGLGAAFVFGVAGALSP